MRWAMTVDEQGITASHAARLTAARAEPHCQLTKSRKPYLHGGYTHIQAEAAMLCDQRGKGRDLCRFGPRGTMWSAFMQAPAVGASVTVNPRS